MTRCRFILSTFYHYTTSEFTPDFSATGAKRVIDRNEIAMGLSLDNLLNISKVFTKVSVCVVRGFEAVETNISQVPRAEFLLLA